MTVRPDDLRAELARRGARLRREIGRRFGDGASPCVSPVHLAALGEGMDRLLDGLDRALDAVPSDALARPETLAEVQGWLHRAASVWQLYRALLDQRRNTDLGPALQVADVCATDGYASALAAARGPAHPGRAEPAPPLVYADAIPSPAIHVRGSEVEVPGMVAQSAVSPVPILLLPADHLECVWLLTLLQHEVGHELDRVLQLAGEVRARLHRAVPTPNDRALWTGWSSEVVADVVGLLLAGTPYVMSLSRFLVSQGAMDEGAKPNEPHPPHRVRLALLLGVVRVVQGGGDLPAELRAIGEQVAHAKLPAHFEEVVNVLTGPLDALQRLPLAGLAPQWKDEQAQLRRAAEALAAGRGVDGLEDLPPRLLPSVAQLALDARAPGDAAAAFQERLHSRVQQALEVRGLPPWALRQTQWSFREDLVAGRLQAPALDLTLGQFRKAPPSQLLERHDRVALVAGSNRNLVKALEEAFKERTRGGKGRWQSLEVFFLTEDALRGTAGPLMNSDELVEQRNAAWRTLSEKLPSWTDRWALYEYEPAYYFASYWDWDVPGGRIHVSPYVWGEEVTACPGLDYTWDHSAPTPQYQTYVRGLEAIRKDPRAHRKLASDPPPPAPTPLTPSPDFGRAPGAFVDGKAPRLLHEPDAPRAGPRVELFCDGPHGPQVFEAIQSSDGWQELESAGVRVDIMVGGGDRTQVSMVVDDLDPTWVILAPRSDRAQPDAIGLLVLQRGAEGGPANPDELARAALALALHARALQVGLSRPVMDALLGSPRGAMWHLDPENDGWRLTGVSPRRVTTGLTPYAGVVPAELRARARSTPAALIAPRHFVRPEAAAPPAGRRLQAQVHAEGRRLTRSLRPGVLHDVRLAIAPHREDWEEVDETFPEHALPSRNDHLLKVAFEVLEPVDATTAPTVHDLILPRVGPSSSVSFALHVPTGAERVVARAVVLHAGRILQTALFTAPVRRTDQESLGDRIRLVAEYVLQPDLDALTQRTAFDAALLHTGAATVGSSRLRVISVEAEPSMWPVDLRGIEDLLTALDEVLSKMPGGADLSPVPPQGWVKRVDPTGAGDAPPPQSSPAEPGDDHRVPLAAPATARYLADLARQGRALRDTMFRDSEVRQALLEAKRIQIVSAREGDVLPLELVYERLPPFRSQEPRVCPEAVQKLERATSTGQPLEPCCFSNDRCVVCPLAFWGVSRTIERVAFQPRATPDGADFGVGAEPGADVGASAKRVSDRQVGPYVSAVVAASDRASSVAREAVDRVTKKIERLVRRHTPTGATAHVQSWEDWRAAVQQHAPPLLVLLPHVSTASGEARLEIAGDRELSGLELDHSFVVRMPVDSRGDPMRDAPERHPLVLLLGCNTSFQRGVFGQIVPRFQRAQAAVVIATLSTLRGRHAGPIAELIVDRLGVPREVGQLVTDLRRELLTTGYPVALTLLAFGDSDWRV